MVSKALFSSNSDDWATPPDFFDYLNRIFAFRLDAAASAHNAKCQKYFTITEDSLAQDWHRYGRVWLNPPYGRGMDRWMRKAYEESQKGCIVVCLVCARTDTQWWHDWVKGKGHVTFVRKRLKFRNPERCPDGKGNSVFASALVTYAPDFDHLLNTGAGLSIGRTGGHGLAGARNSAKQRRSR